VRPRSRVLGETLLICFIGLPIDEAWMMLGDEDLPLGARQASNPLLACASGIGRLVADSTVEASPQHMQFELLFAKIWTDPTTTGAISFWGSAHHTAAFCLLFRQWHSSTAFT